MTHLTKAVRFAVLLPALATDKCPVTSDAPLAAASSEAFDRRVAGKWRCMSQDESSVHVMRIESRTATVLALTFEDNGKTDSATLHSATLGGKKVANMVTRDGAKQEWNVVRFSLLQANILQLGVLVGDLPDTLSAAKQKKAVERLARDNSFEETLLCTLNKESS